MSRPNQPTAIQLRRSLTTAQTSSDRALRLYGNTDERFLKADRRASAIRMQLLICQSERTTGRFFGPVAKAVAALAAIVRDLVAREAPAREIREAVRQGQAEIRYRFLSRINLIADEALDGEVDRLRAQLSPAQIRAGSGLPVDSRGITAPRPGQDPGVIRGSLGLAAILLLAAPLVHLIGSRILESRESARDEVIPEPKRRDRERVRNRFARDPDNKQVSRKPASKVNFITNNVDVAAMTSGTPAENQRAVDKTFGTNGQRGMMQTLASEMRHEALRVSGNSRDTAYGLSDTIVGYILHSVFAETTDPEHAANDGNRYYKDSRRSSTAPWQQRIIPPYRKNCLCFTQGIAEDELGNESFAEFKIAALSGARQITPDDVGGMIYDQEVGGMRTVTEEDVGNRVYSRDDVNALTARDPATWNRWFNQQPRHIKIQLFGQQRYDAVFKRTGQPPKYYEFLKINGDVLTAKEIEREGVGRRKIRNGGIQAIFRKLEQNHIEAWEKGGGKWDFNASEEDRFGRVLGGYLNGLTNQRGR